MADDYLPMYVGDTLNPLSVQFQCADRSAINLTSATLTLVLAAGGTSQVGTGIWTIDDAAAGQAHYDWSDADVAVAGTYQLQVKITIGGKSVHTDPKPWILTPTL